MDVYMKKILHMTPPEVHNGVYRYIFNHMEYIDLNKYNFSFLMRNKADLMKTDEYRKYGFDILSFNNTERYNPDGLRDEIMSVLSNGYDAVHLHTSEWRGFMIEEIAMELKVPHVIVHSHSSGIDLYNDIDRENRLRIHMQFKKQFNTHMATDFCACSNLAAKWLFGENIPREEIKIMPNAINVSKYHFDFSKRRELREKLGVSEKIVVGCVGRYSYTKNQSFLIDVFAKAIKYNKDLFLILIGQGDDREALQKRIRDLQIEKYVLCLNWQNDIERFLQAFDLFCLPSHFEGFPISVIEAQAAGLKCLLSDNITEEASITDLVKYIPLEEDMWIEEVCKARSDDKRTCMDDIIQRKGFDIKGSVKKLEMLYS